MKACKASKMILAAIAAATVSSCSLPPREAWSKIQQEGLLPFLADDSASVKHPATGAKPNLSIPVSTAPVTSQSTVASSQNPNAIGPPAPSAPVTTTAPTQKSIATAGSTAPAPTQPSATMNGDKPLTAQAVPSLPGFVRSPYTNPPRLVDVKGATPGSTMICPYTQRSFIVPGDFVNPGTSVASGNITPPTITLKNDANTTAPRQNPTASAPPSASVFNTPADKPAPTTAANGKPSGNNVAANNNKPSNTNGNKPANNATAAAKPAAADVPFGVPIPGRPGFVNSPFALKHQLVDVTGLPPGMEVKCPYTGKLFRVPAQDIAGQSAVAAPGAPPAPAKNSDKK